MSNVQESLNEAFEALLPFADCLQYIEIDEDDEEWAKFRLLIKNYRQAAIAYDKCKAALADIEKCEPVAEAIRERDRLGFAVVNVIGKLDEIIENTQEVEIDDFLHIAVPVDMWNELQAELEYMPKRADLYTSPQPRDWVGLTDDELKEVFNSADYKTMVTIDDVFFIAARAIESKLKQLNTKG